MAHTKKTDVSKKKKTYLVIGLLVVVILLLVGCGYLYKYSQSKFEATRKDAPMLQFRVSKQNTLMAVTGNLHYYGVIKDDNALQYALEHTKDNTPGKEGAIKVGNGTIDTEAVYNISQNMNTWEIARILLNEGTPSPSACDQGCPNPTPIEPELMPGGDIAPSLKDRLLSQYSWVKNYDDCVEAHGQLSSEQYTEKTGNPRECVNPDSRVFTQGKEGWSDKPSP